MPFSLMAELAAEALMAVTGIMPSTMTSASSIQRILFFIATYSFSSYVSDSIITDLFTNCNPLFQKNYIFVTGSG